MKVLRPNRLLIIASHTIVFLMCFFTERSTSAGEYTARWIGTGNGKWHDEANWDPPRIPNNGGGDIYDVTWDAHPVTITLDREVTIRNFTISQEGVLAGDFNLTIEGNFKWQPENRDSTRGSTPTMAGNALTIVKGTAEILPNRSGQVILRNKRVLALHGRTTMSVGLQMFDEAQIRNEAGGTLEANLGFIRGTLPAKVENFGTFRFLSGPTTYLCNAAFYNHNQVELLQRTVQFDIGYVQDAGTFTIQGGKTIGSFVSIWGGTLAGEGELRGADMGGGAPAVPMPAILSGRLKIGILGLRDRAKLSVTLGGTAEGTFDQIKVTEQMFFSGGFPSASAEESVEVRFAGGFQNSVRPADEFKIVSVEPGAPTLNERWAAVGQRVATRDGFGSFLVDQVPARTGSIFLKHAVLFPPVRFNFPAEPALYPLPNPPGFSIPVHPNATVESRPDVTWAGATLTAKIIQHFAANEDYLEASYGTSELTFVPDVLFGGRVSFRGVPFAVVVPLITADGFVWTFNAQTTPEAVQALVRSLVFRNSNFGFGFFSRWDARFEPRTIQLSFTQGSSEATTFQKEVRFPSLTGITIAPPALGCIEGNLGEVVVVGHFSDGAEFALPELQTEFVSIEPAVPQLQIPAQTNRLGNSSPGATIVLGGTDVYAKAGPFEASRFVGRCPEEFVGSVTFRCGLELWSDNPPSPQGLRQFSAQEKHIVLFYALEALMETTAGGKELAALYWRYTTEVVQLARADQKLASTLFAGFSELQPAIAALLSGKGAAFRISESLVQKLNAVWDQLQQAGSPALQNALAAQRSRFDNFKAFVGKDFSQVAWMLKIASPTQAWIHASSPRFANGQFSVKANYVKGWDYSLWKSPDVAKTISELVATANVQVDGYTVTLIDPSPSASKVFYQIRAIPSEQ